MLDSSRVADGGKQVYVRDQFVVCAAAAEARDTPGPGLDPLAWYALGTLGAVLVAVLLLLSGQRIAGLRGSQLAWVLVLIPAVSETDSLTEDDVPAWPDRDRPPPRGITPPPAACEKPLPSEVDALSLTDAAAEAESPTVLV